MEIKLEKGDTSVSQTEGYGAAKVYTNVLYVFSSCLNLPNTQRSYLYVADNA